MTAIASAAPTARYIHTATSRTPRASFLEIRRDPGCPETVIAEPSCDHGRRCALADHRIGVRLRQHRAGEFAGAAPDRAEQRPLWIVAQARSRRWRVAHGSFLTRRWRKPDSKPRSLLGA